MNANAPIRGERPGDFGGQKTEVEAKQATDKPRGMLAVLIVGVAGAAIAMWLIWTVFFA